MQGAPHTLTLLLPCPPTRANARGHWRTSERQRNKYYAQCAAWFQTQARTIDRTGWPLQRVRWQAHFKVRQLYDADNLAALCKWPLDWMRDVRIIENDDPDHAWPLEWPTQEVAKKREQAVTFHIYPEVR